MAIVMPSTQSKTNLKGEIVNILLIKHPLLARQVHKELVRTRAFSATYQAVHKALTELTAQMVLVRKRKNYELNFSWIQSLEQFCDQYKRNYMKNITKQSLIEGNTQTYFFDRFMDAENYRKSLQSDFFASKEKVVFVEEIPHITSPLVYSEKILSQMNAIRSNKIKSYIIVAGDTILDQWGAEYYNQANVQVKTGIDCAKKCTTMIMGDTIVQLYIPPALRKILDNIFESSTSIADIKVPDLYRKVYKKKLVVKMVITRNQELAEHIRKRIIKEF